MENMGRVILGMGVLLVIVGGLLWAGGRLFGGQDFPGTIRVGGGGFTCVFPLLASIILSIVLTVLLNLAARWFR